MAVRLIVILNEVKDLKCVTGLCTRFFADAQNDREGNESNENIREYG